ncbi:MAG: transcriptional repressor LexA [Verrucomicrobiota bacterium]
MSGLTERQSEMLKFLQDFHHKTGLMPSTREIQGHFGFSSQTAAVSHLRALEKKGVITRLPGKARALAFPEELARERIIDIPIYGQIPAGMGSDAEAVSEGCLSVDVQTIGINDRDKTFALRVRGDSMINAHILDGDFAILQHKEAKAGDVVAALIDGETTLKRLVRQKNQVYLQAENPEFPDLVPAQELEVQGVMVGLVRKGMAA